jgi:hypothetical protein
VWFAILLGKSPAGTAKPLVTRFPCLAVWEGRSAIRGPIPVAIPISEIVEHIMPWTKRPVGLNEGEIPGGTEWPEFNSVSVCDQTVV